MSDKTTRKTLLPRLTAQAAGSFASALLALVAVALIAFGISLIYIPAGVIAAGVGCAVLQWQFFA